MKYYILKERENTCFLLNIVTYIEELGEHHIIPMMYPMRVF